MLLHLSWQLAKSKYSLNTISNAQQLTTPTTICSNFSSASAVTLLEQRLKQSYLPQVLRTVNSDLTRATPLPTPMHITWYYIFYMSMLLIWLIYMPTWLLWLQWGRVCGGGSDNGRGCSRSQNGGGWGCISGGGSSNKGIYVISEWLGLNHSLLTSICSKRAGGDSSLYGALGETPSPPDKRQMFLCVCDPPLPKKDTNETN